jgi:hypothetical protein
MTTDRAILHLALLGAAAVALSACGGDGSSTSAPPVTLPAPFAYMFGNGFGADFTSTSPTPVLLSGNEINAVSLTASPIPFPAGTTGSN